MKKILINIKDFFGNIFDSIFYTEQVYIPVTIIYIISMILAMKQKTILKHFPFLKFILTINNWFLNISMIIGFLVLLFVIVILLIEHKAVLQFIKREIAAKCFCLKYRLLDYGYVSYIDFLDEKVEKNYYIDITEENPGLYIDKYYLCCPKDYQLSTTLEILAKKNLFFEKKENTCQN